MKKTSLLMSLLMLCLVPSAWAVKIGDSAPAFELKNQMGKTQSLKDFHGKWVVLEWFNEGCPFVKKHYGSGNMQKLQAEYTKKGVVWLSVISSAEGKQGFMTEADAQKYQKEHHTAQTAILFDTKGSTGKLYDAKTTPHMFIINPEGKLAYAGGIDDKPSTESSDIAQSKNYIKQALDEGLAGKSISVATSKPYGCSVKY